MGKEDKKEINFEKSIEEIEKIAEEWESGKLNLDESIKKFEEGMNLSKECSKYLENAEKKITMIINDGDSIKEENFVQEDE